MKKVLAFLLSMALLVAPAGCAAEPGQLTLERVEQLAEKGEALTWSDFERRPAPACTSASTM